MVNKDFVQPNQIRAARALLGLDQQALAEAAGTTRQAVVRIEGHTAEKMDLRRRRILLVIAKTLEERFGVEFLPPTKEAGEGVRLRLR